MGFSDEEVDRLGDTAKKVIRGEQMKQVVDAGTTSERAFAADLRRAGIHNFKRNWPKKSRGESWPAPIEKRKWEFDFAWIEHPAICIGCASSLEFEQGMDGETGGHPSDADPPVPGGWYCPECGLDSELPEDSWRSLGVWIHGQVHGQRGTGKVIGDGPGAEKAGPRTRDYEAANVLHAVLYPLGWTIMTFSPQQVGSGVAIRSVKAWLSGDDGAVLLALQGK